MADKQASQAGHSMQAELELLTVHGILHLLGYDHADPEEETEMFGLQGELLSAWRAPTAGAMDRRAMDGRATDAGEGPG